MYARSLLSQLTHGGQTAIQSKGAAFGRLNRHSRNGGNPVLDKVRIRASDVIPANAYMDVGGRATQEP